MLKRFSQIWGRSETGIIRQKQEKEEDNKGYNTGQRELCQKQEFLDRKQESSEDTKEYYAEIGKLW